MRGPRRRLEKGSLVGSSILAGAKSTKSIIVGCRDINKHLYVQKSTLVLVS